MYSYGYDVNARGRGQLANRPAVIDQPFGSGRALLLGYEPVLPGLDRRRGAAGRSTASCTRLGAPVAPDASPAAVAAATEPARRRSRRAGCRLDAADGRQAAAASTRPRLCMIIVKRSQGARSQGASRRAQLSKRLRKRGALRDHAHDRRRS